MELEGFGVSLAGRSVWSHGGRIPWEFINGVNYGTRILIHGPIASMTPLAIMEGGWTCVWHPRHPREWSYIATVLRGTQGQCLVVFADIQEIPASFCTFMDSMTVSRVWLNTEAPPWIPDAVFISTVDDASAMFEMLQNIPGRAGHGSWMGTTFDAWSAAVAATREQGLGLVLSDVEEPTWTLMWYRPADSYPSLERRSATASVWMQGCARLLAAT